MSILPNLLRSILIASVLSFVAPILLIGGGLGFLSLLSYIPTLEAISQIGIRQISHFLAVFGSGSSISGLLIIGLACSLVGVLFDTYTFYRHQNLRGN